MRQAIQRQLKGPSSAPEGPAAVLPAPGARGLSLNDPWAREPWVGDSDVPCARFSAGAVAVAPSIRDFVGVSERKVQHPGCLIPGRARPHARDYSPWRSKRAPAWVGQRGARGVAAAEPSPDGERGGKRCAEPAEPPGGHCAVAGCNPARSPLGIWSSAVGVPGRVHGGGMWVGRALIALGKVGQRVPSARPSSSEGSLFHAHQL